MSATTNLQLPYILPAQSQKHVTVNESLRILDALVLGRVESFGETTLFSDTYTCSAIADKPSRIATIEKKLFRQALAADQELTTSYISQLTYRYQTVKTLLELRSIRSAR